MTTLFFSACLLSSALAMADDNEAIHSPEQPHAAEEAQHEEGGHATEEGGHHVDYLGDDDGDHVPNWRDRTNDQDPEQANEAYVVKDILLHAFNLFLLLALLFWLMRKPVKIALKNRADSIRRELTEAARLRDEAEKRHQELSARLDHFEDEVQAIRDEAKQDAQEEEAKLIERAHQEAKRIAETTERNIRDEVSRARLALQREAVELAVELAQKTLASELKDDDQKRLAREFLSTIKNNGVGNHG